MNQDDETSSNIDKKLREAKRNSILNSLGNSSIAQFQQQMGIIDNDQDLSAREKLMKEIKPVRKRIIERANSTNLGYLPKKRPQLLKKRTNFSINYDDLNDEPVIPVLKQQVKINEEDFSTTTKVVNVKPISKEIVQQFKLRDEQKPVNITVTNLKQEEIGEETNEDKEKSKIKKSTLEQRKKTLINLLPLITTKSGPNQDESEDEENQEEHQDAEDINKSEYKTRKRRQTIKKFQNCVRVALEQDKLQGKFAEHQEEEEKFDRLQTIDLLGKDLNTKSDLLQCANPMNKRNSKSSTPLLRTSKYSLFDVVKKLNLFGRKKSDTTSHNDDPLNSSRMLLQKEQEEIQLRKKERARQLWRKTKLVVRAFNAWKTIQNEIQLYGTRNYEFRQNFKFNLETNKVKKQATIKVQSPDSRGEKNMNSSQALSPSRTIDKVSQKQKCATYIHPESKFKQIWSLIIVLLLFYVGLLMPFKMAFLSHDDIQWITLDNLTDFFFIVDIIINSLTAFYDDNEEVLVTDNKIIMINYLKGWFVIDLISSVPISLILENQAISGQYWQLVRLLRLPRLSRLFKLTKVFQYLQTMAENSFLFQIYEFIQVNSGLMRVITIVGTCLMCIHIAACFWFLTARIDSFSPDTWVVRNDFHDETIIIKYLASIYWSVATVLTVGYGDIHAQTMQERILSIFWMMIGVAFYTFNIGILNSVLSKIDMSQFMFTRITQEVEEFCSEVNISFALKKKIREALEYHSKKDAFFIIKRQNLFNPLPPQLKYEIAVQIHDGAMGKLLFFQKKDEMFIATIVPMLKPLQILEGEYIYMQGDHPYEIYLIASGRVNFLMEIGDCVFKSWPKGSYFGDIEILFNKCRICTAKADSNCDIFTLNKKIFQTVIYKYYPDIEKELRELALEREYRILHALKKAHKVLEKIGIIDALQLPMRQRQKKNSVASIASSKKKTLFYLDKISTMKKITQSFDRAHHKSIVSSQFSESEKRHHNKAIDLKEHDTSQIKEEEQESSSSGNFNIWGDKNQSSDDEQEEADVLGDIEQSSQKKVQRPPRHKIRDSFQTDQSYNQSRKTSNINIDQSDQYTNNNNKAQIGQLCSPPKMSNNSLQPFDLNNGGLSSFPQKRKYSQFEEQKYQVDIQSTSNNNDDEHEELKDKQSSEKEDDEEYKDEKMTAGFDNTLPHIHVIEEVSDKEENQDSPPPLKKKDSDKEVSPPNPDNFNFLKVSYLYPLQPAESGTPIHSIKPIRDDEFFYQNPNGLSNLISPIQEQNSKSKNINHDAIFDMEHNKSQEYQAITHFDNSSFENESDRNYIIPSIKINDQTVQKSKFWAKKQESLTEIKLDLNQINQVQLTRTPPAKKNESDRKASKGEVKNAIEITLFKGKSHSQSSGSNTPPVRKTLQLKPLQQQSILGLQIIAQPQLQRQVSVCKSPTFPIQRMPSIQKQGSEAAKNVKELETLKKKVKDYKKKLQEYYDQQKYLESKVSGLEGSLELMTKLFKDVIEKTKQKDQQLKYLQKLQAEKKIMDLKIQTAKRRFEALEDKVLADKQLKLDAPLAFKNQDSKRSHRDNRILKESIHSNQQLTYSKNDESIISIHSNESQIQSKKSSTTIGDFKKNEIFKNRGFTFTDDLEQLQQNDEDNYQRISDIPSSGGRQQYF